MLLLSDLAIHFHLYIDSFCCICSAYEAEVRQFVAESRIEDSIVDGGMGLVVLESIRAA